MRELRITKEQARRFLVRYQCLDDDETGLSGKEGVMAYFARVRCVQFDPLNVIGHNQEIALRARAADFTPEMLRELLYRDYVLYDQWDKNMSICMAEDWPYFSRFRSRYLPWIEKHIEAVVTISRYLEEHECACSSDFELEEKVGWHYGPQRLAKAALECMCYAGLAVVHHKKGTRRYYALAEKHIPPEILQMPEPNDTPEKYHAWHVLRRIKAIGLLWNRPGDAWLGIQDFKSGERNAAFSTLLTEGKIIPITVEGIKDTFYIAAEYLSKLEDVTSCQQGKPSARILAPLDNMLWDRRLAKAVFDFEYKWEVYTPAAQRKYGYYVLPILYGDRLVGRLEPEKRERSMGIRTKNLWWEEGLANNSEMKRAVEECLNS